MYHIVFDNDNFIFGIYDDASYIEDGCSYITVDKELHDYILSLRGKKKYHHKHNKDIYTIEDRDCFELVIGDIELEETPEEKMDKLEKENQQMKEELEQIKKALGLVPELLI